MNFYIKYILFTLLLSVLLLHNLPEQNLYEDKKNYCLSKKNRCFHYFINKNIYEMDLAHNIVYYNYMKKDCNQYIYDIIKEKEKINNIKIIHNYKNLLLYIIYAIYFSIILY